MTKIFRSVGIALVIMVGQVAFADNGNGPVPAATAAPQFNVNPTTLRQRLLESNLSIVQEYNQLNISKHKVEFARASLLPGVSLNVQTFSSFGLSEIQYLLPFLVPTNWFNYSASKHQLDADKISYYIVELNVYSSALGVYFNTLADSQAEPLYERLAQDFQGIANYYKIQALKGSGDMKEYLAADGVAKNNIGYALGVQGAVMAEQETLRSMLNILDANTKIVLDPFILPASEFENMDHFAADLQANKVAPEHAQVKALLAEGTANEWGTIFSFITGAQLSGSSSNGGLSNLAGGIGITLTPNLVPNIKLSKDNITVVRTQDDVLTNGLNQTVNTALDNLTIAKQQQVAAAQAEADANTVYNIDKLRYLKSQITFTDLKSDANSLTLSTIQRIRADQNLNLARVTMERTFLIDQFANIQPCKMGNAPKKKSGVHLDDLCKPGPGH